MPILTGITVATCAGLRSDVTLVVDAGKVSAILDEYTGAAEDLGGAVVMAGFVDQHCHGGGGGDFFSGDAEQIRVAARTHLEHGTTSLIASLVTATTDDLLEQLTALAPVVADGTLAGVHLEGPWLSRHECGAHDRSLLRAPDPAEIDLLLEAHGDIVRMVTLAPELPGGIEAIRRLVAAGVVVAIGHTAADWDTTCHAIDAGATVATHLLNKMPPMHKRRPGPVLALIQDPRVVCELIMDGVHLHPGMQRFVIEYVGPDRVAAVTDAMGAAGAAQGRYTIGQLDVDVVDGQARLTHGGALAGSVLTMDGALRSIVDTDGLGLADATRMLSATPARAMGLADRGQVQAGMRADLVVLNPDLSVRRVMRGGRWVDQE